MEKLIKNGYVAVLVSPGYGAGWYSWEGNKAMLFDRVLAEMLEDGRAVEGDPAWFEKIEQIAKQRYPDAYLGGLEGLCVHWVPEGVRFRIEEYDGAESLRLESSYDWITA